MGGRSSLRYSRKHRVAPRPKAAGEDVSGAHPPFATTCASCKFLLIGIAIVYPGCGARCSPKVGVVALGSHARAGRTGRRALRIFTRRFAEHSESARFAIGSQEGPARKGRSIIGLVEETPQRCL